MITRSKIKIENIQVIPEPGLRETRLSRSVRTRNVLRNACPEISAPKVQTETPEVATVKKTETLSAKFPSVKKEAGVEPVNNPGSSARKVSSKKQSKKTKKRPSNVLVRVSS